MIVTALALVLVVCLGHTQAHTYHLGDCPNVEPLHDFDIEKFLGKWYVIQKTSTGSTCLVNQYYKDEENSGQYKIEQISDHVILGLTSYDHKYHYTGDLTIPSRQSPAAMRVQFPLNVAGGASYTVFMTDYDTYAGVFTCQKLAFAHRQSATILSRAKTLDKMYLDKIRSRMSSYGVDPHNLSIIRQSSCTESINGTDISIDSDTFSTGNIANTVRKVGESIGDGVEYIGDNAKKLYNKARGNSEVQEGSEINRKADAEWLP